jgi:hypothetical protein
MIRNVQPGALGVMAVLLGFPSWCAAQGFAPVTTRAAGLAGAFVAVADDASAVYWNPGALASGAFFSFLVDRTSGKSTVEEPSGPLGGSRSGTLLALSTPPFGLSYYRLRSTWVSPDSANIPGARAETLIMHNTGVTLVHSLADGVAVGTTIRFVRGIATAAAIEPAGDIDDLLDEASDLVGEASNKVDADVGVSAVRGPLRAGLTIRNVAGPKFETAGGESIQVERQARAGVALSSPLGFVVALDADLNAVRGPAGEVRELAVGAEARLVPRAYARAGIRSNMLGSEPGGHAPTFSVGGSYAVLASLWIDGQATLGSAAGDRGWGIAGRVGF